MSNTNFMLFYYLTARLKKLAIKNRARAGRFFIAIRRGHAISSVESGVGGKPPTCPSTRSPDFSCSSLAQGMVSKKMTLRKRVIFASNHGAHEWNRPAGRLSDLAGSRRALLGDRRETTDLPFDALV